jgi:hypothetical protein
VTGIHSGVDSGLDSDVLVFPFAASLDFPAATLSDRIGVGPPVELTLLDEFFLDQRVEIGIEPPVVDFGLIVVFKFIFDRQSVGFILACDGVQYVALESGQVVHIPLVVIPTVKYIGSRKDNPTEWLIHRLDSQP